METVIYADTLFIINFIMNVFILSLTTFILKKEIHILKVELVSLLCALYAVFMFFPELKIFYSGLFKILFLFIPTGLLFGFSDFRQLVKNTFICLLTAMGFCGCTWTIIAVTGISVKHGAIISNGILYLDINPLVLIVGILLTVAALVFFHVFQDRDRFKGKVYNFKAVINGRSYNLYVLYDTGCRLKSKNTGLPAIIVERGIFDEDFYADKIKNIDSSKLTYTTITNEHEAIASFMPESITDKKYSYSAIIGLSPVARLDPGGHFNAVMNPAVLETKIRIDKKLAKRKEMSENEQIF